MAFKNIALSLLLICSILKSSLSLNNPVLSKSDNKDVNLRKRRMGDDSSSSSSNCDKFSSRKFMERAGSDMVIFNTQDGKLNPGDVTVWNNDVYDSDDIAKKGTIQGFCVFLPELVYECSITLRLHHGNIMFQGSFLDNPDHLAVTGGTNCYEKMRGGEVRVTASYNGNAERTQYKVMLN